MEAQDARENQRQFARVETKLPVTLRIASAERFEQVKADLERAPSVWAPTDEIALVDMAAVGRATVDARLGRALLEVCERLAVLEARWDHQAPGATPATILELSGGGGKLESTHPLEEGASFEMRLVPNSNGIPPLRALLALTGRRDRSSICYGFRFAHIHPTDQARLIRMIYGIQRQALRDRNS